MIGQSALTVWLMCTVRRLDDLLTESWWRSELARAAHHGGVRASTSPSKEHYAIVPHDNVVNLIYAGL